jgi:DNA mismatch repair protein MutS2
MTFTAGQPVHVQGIGKGTVREVRNGGRYLVDVGARSIVTSEDQLTAIEAPKRAVKTTARPVYETPSESSLSIDLHGHTVDEAVEALAAFLNRALLAGAREVQIIHGRSGGKIKAAVHAQLKGIVAVKGFSLDPSNAGVTIVKL